MKLLDGGRKKWELDGRALTDEAPERDGDVVHRARSRTRRSAPSATRSSTAIGTKNLVDVRSPDEFAGRLLAPAHLPQEQAQRAGHIPTAGNVPWSKAANDDGTFRSDDELERALPEAGLDDGEGHHRLLPHRRALVAHLVRAARSCSASENVKNYDGSWTEYGSLVGVPIALGDEPGEA